MPKVKATASRKKLPEESDMVPDRFLVIVNDIPKDVGACIKEDAVGAGTTYAVAIKVALRAYYKSEGRLTTK